MHSVLGTQQREPNSHKLYLNSESSLDPSGAGYFSDAASIHFQHECLDSSSLDFCLVPISVRKTAPLSSTESVQGPWWDSSYSPRGSHWFCFWEVVWPWSQLEDLSYTFKIAASTTTVIHLFLQLIFFFPNLGTLLLQRIHPE